MSNFQPNINFEHYVFDIEKGKDGTEEQPVLLVRVKPGAAPTRHAHTKTMLLDISYQDKVGPKVVLWIWPFGQLRGAVLSETVVQSETVNNRIRRHSIVTTEEGYTMRVSYSVPVPPDPAELAEKIRRMEEKETEWAARLARAKALVGTVSSEQAAQCFCDALLAAHPSFFNKQYMRQSRYEQLWYMVSIFASGDLPRETVRHYAEIRTVVAQLSEAVRTRLMYNDFDGDTLDLDKTRSMWRRERRERKSA